MANDITGKAPQLLDLILNAPFRLMPVDTPATQEGLARLALIRREK
jgi:hypothetical protein